MNGEQGPDSRVNIVGAGPAGTLLAILLARRGRGVTLFERLPDLRRALVSAGRSINLALAERGIHALKLAGVFDALQPHLIPMRGRMLHDVHGHQSLLPYGSDPREAIYSISRTALNAILLDCVERLPNVELRFRQTCIAVDQSDQLAFQDLSSGKLYTVPLNRVVGADGAGSVLRHFLADRAHATCSEDLLPHGYKEITLPPASAGAHRFDPHALHVWPRGNFMLIALPNPDGSFTATLFLAYEGEPSFTTLNTAEAVEVFFRTHFPDATDFIPDVAAQFHARPTGVMGTVRCSSWTLADRLVLIGDAAHAIVPFHGQGMNCAFEDCGEFAALLDSHGDWGATCAAFEQVRRPNTDAIADMALENYVEMRDTVRDPSFLLQKELSLELERRFPDRFVPRYSMVMFHHEIPYSTAKERGAIQNEILAELTLGRSAVKDVDFEEAEKLIQMKLPRLGAAADP